MWGLIYKDIITNKKALLFSLFAMLVTFVLFSLPLFIIEDAEDNIDGVSQMIALLISVCSFLFLLDIPTTLIKSDESARWSAFVAASESTVKGQMQSKYVLSFITLVFTVNFLYFALFIDDMILYSAAGVTGMTALTNITILAAFLILMYWAVEIPFTVYFGSKTGGMIKTVFFSLITLGIIIYGLYGKEKISFEKLFDIIFAEVTDKVTLLILFAIEIGAAVMYYLSYRLSCKLYLKGAENFE